MILVVMQHPDEKDGELLSVPACCPGQLIFEQPAPAPACDSTRFSSGACFARPLLVLKDPEVHGPHPDSAQTSPCFLSSRSACCLASRLVPTAWACVACPSQSSAFSGAAGKLLGKQWPPIGVLPRDCHPSLLIPQWRPLQRLPPMTGTSWMWPAARPSLKP